MHTTGKSRTPATMSSRLSAQPVLGVRDGSVTLAPVGLVGGMSWRSTALYYERLNREFERRFGGNRTLPVIIASLDYASLISAADAGGWERVERVLVDAASWLERSGCGVIALTAVTAHLSHAAMADTVDVAVPHVLAAAAGRLDELRITRVGILGTGRTCGSGFVREMLAAGSGREIVTVSAALQNQIDRMIHERLSVAQVTAEDRHFLLTAITSLQRQGAQAVLLACTELPLLLPLPGSHAELPVVIDTVELHVAAICNQIKEIQYS